MSKRPEVSDVIKRFLPAYMKKHSLLPSHQRALSDICNCMTEAMGGGRYYCTDCEATFWSYHGCRNRSCPKCHGRQTADWIKKRQAEIFPCQYFHVVATAPSELRDLFQRNQKLLYGILMKSAAHAICLLAKDPHYLGAEPGILSALHTWDTETRFHPHVHMLVTGGGVDQDVWRDVPNNNYFVPVEALSILTAKRFSELLQKGAPDIHKQIPPEVWQREWVSYCKPFKGDIDAILNYLGRYVFRIAITNARILSMDENSVTLRCKNNKTDGLKIRTISGVEFIRRFVQHILPRGFHKVRYYGLWSPAKRKTQASVQLMLHMRKESRPLWKIEAPLKIADLAEEALQRSEIEAHGNVVKCPKCSSIQVVCQERLRRQVRILFGRRREWVRQT